jgi:hypothetical protein
MDHASDDSSWTSFVDATTTTLSDPPSALWDESPGSAIEFSFDGATQQSIMSSSLPGHPSPAASPLNGSKLSFYSAVRKVSH